MKHIKFLLFIPLLFILFSFINRKEGSNIGSKTVFKNAVRVLKQVKIIDSIVLSYALEGVKNIEDSLHVNFKYIAIVDFSKPSTEQRFFLLDLTDTSLVCVDYVCHGKYSGENFATSFSNQIESNKSSLGFYRLSETYMGAHGLSIRMDGLDNGFNNNARKRAIVMHTADYANASIIKELGRFGRSLGCPTLPEKTFNQIATQLSNNAIIFQYYPDKKYLESSVWLHK
jgi:hypothetical protein